MIVARRPLVGLFVVLAVATLVVGRFGAGSSGSLATAADAGVPVSTLTASNDGPPVATAAPLPDRPHLVDRRPDRTVDGLVVALAVLLVLGLDRRDTSGRRATKAAVANHAGPPPATRAWHRRGPPALLST